MPRLENPLTFTNVVKSSLIGDKIKDVEAVVPTKAIEDFYNPVKKLPEDPEEAKKTLTTLTLKRGEVKEFTDGEAEFLLSKYPWLEVSKKKAKKGKKADNRPPLEPVEKARPKNIDIDVDIDKGEM